MYGRRLITLLYCTLLYFSENASLLWEHESVPNNFSLLMSDIASKNLNLGPFVWLVLVLLFTSINSVQTQKIFTVLIIIISKTSRKFTACCQIKCNISLDTKQQSIGYKYQLCVLQKLQINQSKENSHANCLYKRLPSNLCNLMCPLCWHNICTIPT